MSTLFAPQQFLPYENFTLGIRMKYPADWLKQDQFPGSMVLFSSPPEGPLDFFRENVLVLIEALPPGATLQEYVDTTIAQGKAVVPNLSVLSSHAGSLSGEPALELLYTYSPGPPLKCKMVCALRNDRSYLLTYTAEAGKYEKFLVVAQPMFDSFEIG